MDLFVVNRYYGDQSSQFLVPDNPFHHESNFNDTNHKESLPSNAIERVFYVNSDANCKKRRKSEGLAKIKEINVPDNNASLSHGSKKKKTSKTNETDDSKVEINETESSINDGSSTKSKKKRKSEQLVSGIENTEAKLKKTIPGYIGHSSENNIVCDVNLSKKKSKSSIGNCSTNSVHNSDIENEMNRSSKDPKTNRKSKSKKDEIAIDIDSNGMETADDISNKTKKRKSKRNSLNEDIDASDFDKINDNFHESKKVIKKSEETRQPNNLIKPNKNKLKKKLKSKKNMQNKAVDNNQNNADENIVKKPKRFRQRSRYKNKPVLSCSAKKDVIKDENDDDNTDNGDENDNTFEENEEENDTDKEKEEENGTDELDGFQVIGNLEFQSRKQVKRVLPDWLANPTVISVNLQYLNMSVDKLPLLNPYFKQALKKNKVTHFFPVQSELIPFILKQYEHLSIFWPRDICVSAPTGSGKTLAFVLPIVQLLSSRVVPYIRALVVLPTQDLAAQVYSVFKTYVKGTKLKIILATGSTSIQEEQINLVHKNLDGVFESLVDIVITTPGRLVDHLTHTPGFDLSELKFLVVDEADRMIDNNDCNWLVHINKHINYLGLNSIPPIALHTFQKNPRRPQRLLFSATLSHDPEKLQQLSLFHPKLFTSVTDPSDDDAAAGTNESPNISDTFIGKFTTPNELKEKLTICSNDLKPLVLYHLIKKYSMKGVLCFVNTTQGAHRLAKLLHHIERASTTTTTTKEGETKSKLNIAEVYSDLKFEQRKKIIQDFSKGKVDIVVASDNLARGIDVHNIDYVINYEAPTNVKKYIHRVGRTGRGGRDGTSITFVTSDQKSQFLKMLSSVGKTNLEEFPYSKEELEDLEDIYTKSLEFLKKDIEREGELSLKIAKAVKKGKKIIKYKKGKKIFDKKKTKQQRKKINKTTKTNASLSKEKTNEGDDTTKNAIQDETKKNDGKTNEVNTQTKSNIKKRQKNNKNVTETKGKVQNDKTTNNEGTTNKVKRKRIKKAPKHKVVVRREKNNVKRNQKIKMKKKLKKKKEKST